MPGNGATPPGNQPPALPVWLKRGRTIEVRAPDGLWESGIVQSIRERNGRTWLKVRLFQNEASFDLSAVRLRCGSEEFPTNCLDASGSLETPHQSGCAGSKISAQDDIPPSSEPSTSVIRQVVGTPDVGHKGERSKRTLTVHSSLKKHAKDQSPDEHEEWQRTAQALADLFALNDFPLYASRMQIELETDRVCFQVPPCLAKVDLLDYLAQECWAYCSRRAEHAQNHRQQQSVPRPTLPETVFAELLSTVTFLCDGEHQETQHLLTCIAKRPGLVAVLKTYIQETLIETVQWIQSKSLSGSDALHTSASPSDRVDHGEHSEERLSLEQEFENRAFVALNVFMTGSNLMDAAIRALLKRHEGISSAESGSNTDEHTAMLVLRALVPPLQMMGRYLGVVFDWADSLQDPCSSSLKPTLRQRLRDELDEHLRLLLGTWMSLTSSETDALLVSVQDQRLARHLVRLYPVERVQDALSMSDQQRLQGQEGELELALWTVLERWPVIATTRPCWLQGSEDIVLVHFHDLCTEIWGAASARQLERYAASPLRKRLLETLTKLYIAEPSLLIRVLNDPNRLPALERMLKRLWELVAECLRGDESEDESDLPETDLAAYRTLQTVRQGFLPAAMHFLAKCHLLCCQRAPELFLQRLASSLGFSSRRGLDRLLTVLRRLPLVAGHLHDPDTRAAFMLLLHTLEARRREEPSRFGTALCGMAEEPRTATQLGATRDAEQSWPLELACLPAFDWSRIAARDFGERTWYTLLSYRLALLEDKYRRILDTDRGKPSPFVHLSANEYLVPSSSASVQADICQCVGRCIPGICLNSNVCVECNSQTCPVVRSQNLPDRDCGNMRFQRQAYASVELFFSRDGRGCGIRTREALKKGDFIVEYMGEVIDHVELARRKREQQFERHVYFMTLDQHCFLDASREGTWGRFLNHACEPNCHTQKWIVLGKARVGIFASRDIAAGEELTFDYRMERRAGHATEQRVASGPAPDDRSQNLIEGESIPIRCVCGAPSCTGWISGDSLMDAEEEQRLLETFTKKRVAYLQHLAEQIEAMKKALEPHRRSRSSVETTAAPTTTMLCAWADEEEQDAIALQPSASSATAVGPNLSPLNENDAPFIPRRKRPRPVDDAQDADSASASKTSLEQDEVDDKDDIGLGTAGRRLASRSSVAGQL
ncbi:hypothetical protein F1559_000396 [Cyanidiococcus yangmingshanensis]|uniref:Uncharacterized protein n=1 Tax=Cyanidiococcus yangmingshanensis TaxID=2690220 RepID=A0A7J7IHP3_9RHOD|nr:hypothetical protein F1559_000396 [Cyanidiococcus yangmingshanensis]